jgi:hypothetical protein
MDFVWGVLFGALLMWLIREVALTELLIRKIDRNARIRKQ